MKCSKNLFSNNNSLVIPSNWDYSGVNIVVSEIIQEFQDSKVDYQLQYDGTTDIESYIESIDQFIDSLLNQIPVEFNEYDKGRIINLLKLNYYPSNTKISREKDNIPISAIIPEADLKSKHEQNEVKLDTLLSEFFGTNTLLKTNCKNVFKHDIFGATVILRQGKNSQVVTNVQDLNNNIENYKNQLYKNVYDYLISKGITPELQVTQMFVQSGDREHKLNPGYIKVLDDFYILINSPLLQDQLETEWIKEQTSDSYKSSMLKAVNSYIQLLHFDELLENQTQNYLSINDNMDQIILDNGDGTWSYKYSFGDTNQMAHGWWTEVRDATKELGSFSRFLIENIPLRGSTSYMSIIDYFTAMLKLKDHILSSTVSQELKQLMENAHNYPEENIKKIFESIFTKDGNVREDIKLAFENDLIDYKLNDNDYKVIESLYDFLYNGNESVYSIESKQISKSGLTSQYPILKSILGAFDSTSQMDYIEVVYDYDSQKYKVSTKKKYASKKSLYDFIDNINRKTRERGRELLFDSWFDDKKRLHTQIGELEYILDFSDQNLGILNSKAAFKIAINDENNQILSFGQHLTTYFGVNLDTISARQKLIDGVNLSDKEMQFMDLVEFLDTNLGTTFGQDEQGLQELNLYLGESRIQEGRLKDIFRAASKVAEVTKLHKGFANQDEISDFKEYLSQNYPFKVISNKNLDKDLKRTYFYSNYRGEFLYGLSKQDSWIDNLMEARRIITGENTQAVTKNLEGSSIPNTSPAFLGREIKQIISDQKTGPTQNLLFNQNPNSIIGIVIDTDVRTNTGKVKSVSSFSPSELLYHNFINKFILPMQKGRMFVQPTVYSDKKKFIVYDVDVTSLLGNPYRISNKGFEQKFIDTIGQAYYQMFNKVQEDYFRIYPEAKTLQDINNIIRNKSSEDFIRDAQNAGIDVMEDIHYRKGINGGLSINELLQYYSDMYNNPDEISKRLTSEKYKFINQLSQNRVSFVQFDELNKALYEAGASNWIENGLMALAKDKDGNNIFYGNIPSDAIINPLLEKYFYTSTLLSNNLRLSLIGTELNHKVKDLKGITSKLENKFNKEQIKFIRKYSKLNKNQKINLPDIKFAIDNYISSLRQEMNQNDIEFISELENIYKQELYKIETAEQNAQLKRTVTVPGTMRYFLQDSLDGIADTMKCAVIEDVPAEVYQFSGKQDGTIDSHDGSAFIDPITSILENNSLQDSEVGTIKKTLWHDFNEDFMSAELVKYAQHTITNQWMRQSENSSIKLYDMFRKMTDVYHWTDEQIPDITNMAYHKNSTKLNFAEDILQGNALYYKIGNQSRRIEDFGKDEFGYYTEESVVTSEGKINNEFPKTKYYHFFNGRNHYRIQQGQQIPENSHSISSIFELHAALGGIYSMSLMNDGELHYSESSNHAVANFINNVSIPKVDLRTKPSKTQTNFEQPLKKMMINYLLNQSSIKNGAQNINKSNVYFNDAPLRSFTLSTKRYGIQQDSDHEADEARMTEFSQVISSLDAGGHYHDFVKEVYEVLGQVALEASQAEIQAIEEFNNNGDYDKLYDIVGRTIIQNLSLGSGKAGLAESIILSLRKEFNLSTNHANDLKIPFSDPNMYSQILSTISSIINKKSVKREYPGNGMVMTPGYKICQLWDIDGQTLQFEDILKQIQVVPNFGESISDANRRSVKEYLNQKQQEIPILEINKAQSFYPSDNVNIHYTINNQDFVETIELDTMLKYQNFINDTENCIKGLLLAKGIVPENIIGLQKNITLGRDLAPAKITYSYYDSLGNQIDTNIFASYVYRNAYGDPTKEQKQAIQKYLNNLDQGFIYLTEEDEFNDVKTQIFNFKSTPAETILSNIYQSKFGLNYYDSINDVKEESFSVPLNISYSPLYDIALVKGNGRNLYISINSSEEKQIKSWKNLTKTDSIVEGKPVHNIYVTDNNIRLFQIGREIIMNNYSYKDGKFFNEKGEQVLGEYSWDGKNVWKYVEFVENAKASLENGKNFRFYNINKSKLREVFQGNDNDLNSYVAKLIKDIYNSDSYQILVPNNNLATSKLNSLSSIFYSLATQTKENTSMQQVLFDISGLLHGLSNDKTETTNLRKKKIGETSYRTYIQNYLDTLTHKKFVSFQKSQDFTSSRIPAQTLQSFMYMKAVGFTGVHTNQAYVSHFQTYLQGSDYDIDKSYMLGHEFDDNGIYLGWSSLFDYSSIDSLHASENLPFPKGRIYIRSNNGIDINSYVQAILQSEGIQKINNIAKLLKFLNRQENLQITYDGDDSIVNLLNQHESTYIAPINKVATLKNFISSHIQKQIQATKNMMAAYSPIEMTDLQNASRTTPKALNSNGLSVLNPAMIAIMQNQNMVGKNVVGIAANGQKANLMWNYYMNDVVRLPENHPERQYSKFTFVSSRINRRSYVESDENKKLPIEQQEKLQSIEIHGLPDTNWDFENGQIVQQEYENSLNPSISSDLMESQFISAATDNAKELILDKINSGQQTAKCYLYLVTLGFDVKDIVKFMTSPAVSFIESMAQENVFSEYFSTLEDITKNLIANCISRNQRDTDITRFLANKTNEEIQEIKADAQEFQRVLAGANEFSNFGRILGINQGVPTTKEKLASWKRAFKNIIQQREKYLEIIDDKGNFKENNKVVTQEERVEFDFDRYFKDSEYRETLKQYYDKIKEGINIFAAIDYIPHFKAMFEMLNIVNTIDSNISLKSRLNNYYMDQATSRLRRVDDNTTNKINSAINILLIQHYIGQKGLSIPTKQGWEIFDDLGSRITSSGNNILLTTPETLKSFQFIFEQYIIPQLQNGTYFEQGITLKDGTQISAEEANNLVKRNSFIKGLVSGNDGNIPLYKLDIDMLSIDKSPISKMKYQKYLDGFIDLHNIPIGGISLSDWFMVYNLVRNKNNYGRDRFTTLFQELISKDNSDYILSDYLAYIGNQDYTKELYNEIIENNSLEAILQATAKTVRTFVGQYDMYVKIYNESGEPEYYVNETGKRGQYRRTSNGIPYIEGEENKHRNQRIADNEEYGFGLLTSNYANQIFKQLQSNWVTTVGALIERGYIQIENKCD